MTPRTDDQTAAWIALAVFLKHVVNYDFSVRLLLRYGVPSATVERVLQSLHRREF